MGPGEHEDGDASSGDDWMRSGLNADAPTQAPGPGPTRGGLFRLRTALLGAGFLAAGALGTSVVLSTTRGGADAASDGPTGIDATTTPANTTAYSSSAAPTPDGLDNWQALDALATADPGLA